MRGVTLSLPSNNFVTLLIIIYHTALVNLT